jgi:hypothetical protein
MKLQYDGLVYFEWMFMNMTLIMFHKQVHEIPYDPTKNYKSFTNYDEVDTCSYLHKLMLLQ